MQELATEITTELKKLQNLPTPVSGWEVEAGSDSTNNFAVWVWVILKNDHVDTGTRSRLRELVRNLVRRKTTAWVYVRFRGASEVGHAT